MYLDNYAMYINDETMYDKLCEQLQQHLNKKNIPILACVVDNSTLDTVAEAKTLAQMLNVMLHVYLKTNTIEFDKTKQEIEQRYLSCSSTSILYSVQQYKKTVF